MSIRAWGAVLASLLLSSCASFLTRSPLEWDEAASYRHNARFTVKGFEENGEELFRLEKLPGVSAVPPAHHYDITVESADGSIKMDWVVIRTCGRDTPVEKKGSDFTFTYTPNLMERECANMLQIKGFERDWNRPTFGLLIFKEKDVKYALPATLSCDGKDRNVIGTDVCHMAQDLRASVFFQVKVRALTKKKECEFPSNEGTKDGTRFNFTPFPQKSCEILYMEMESPYRRLSLYLRPYKYSVVTGEKTK